MVGGGTMQTNLVISTGLLNATQIQLEYLRLQPPDEDGANIVVAVPIVNPAPLTVDSVSQHSLYSDLQGSL
jgi:hypothetical protein